MHTKKSFRVLFIAIVLSICNTQCNTESDKKGTVVNAVTSSDNNELNGAVIKNDIEIEASGVKLAEAYLMDENRIILTENTTTIGKKIYCVVKVDTGWTKANSLSYIGASERISADDGTVVVNATDIFKDYDLTGLDAKDAGTISLSAVITQNSPAIDYFVVNFKVWDKKGKGEIKGKYKFKIK